VDGEQLTAHLGITFPLIPVLTARGYRTSYRSCEGDRVFEHPVPSASHPSAPGDRHSVLIVHVADGVDAGDVTLSDAGSLGVEWMQLHPAPSNPSAVPRRAQRSPRSRLYPART